MPFWKPIVTGHLETHTVTIWVGTIVLSVFQILITLVVSVGEQMSQANIIKVLQSKKKKKEFQLRARKKHKFIPEMDKYSFSGQFFFFKGRKY